MTMKKGRLFIISAPSGTGKTTVVKRLRESVPGLTYSISYTTRKPRGAEQNGQEYYFVDEKTFRSLIDDDFFAEWASVHGALYGTPREAIEGAIEKGLNVVMDIDVQGGMALKARYPEAVSIFLTPPNDEELKKRLVGRKTDSPETIATRLKNAEYEMTFKNHYDYCVINDDLKRACDELVFMIHSKTS